jgi:hypothetical protein
LDIALYEGKWTRFAPRVKEAEREAEKQIRLHSIDEDKLQQYLSEYRSCEEQQKDYKRRTRKYEHIPALLDRLVTVKTSADFLEIYEQLVGKRGQWGLWHSGGLFRNKNRVADRFSETCAMVRKVREHPEASVAELFALGIPNVKSVTGLGVNVLTEVMNSYYPDRCPVLNGNSLDSLRHLAIGQFPADPQSFKAEHYKRFAETLKDLRNLCGLESMGHVDHLLSYVYWKYVKPAVAKS